MTRRAFVPSALIEAQPRIYKSFRGRQLKGLMIGAGGAALVLIPMGVKDLSGYLLAFLAALPGFAYGYYKPEGKPVEEWLMVLVRFYATSQRISAVPPRPRWSWPVLRAQFDPIIRAAWWTMKRPNPKRKGHQSRGV